MFLQSNIYARAAAMRIVFALPSVSRKTLRHGVILHVRDVGNDSGNKPLLRLTAMVRINSSEASDAHGHAQQDRFRVSHRAACSR